MWLIPNCWKMFPENKLLCHRPHFWKRVLSEGVTRGLLAIAQCRSFSFIIWRLSGMERPRRNFLVSFCVSPPPTKMHWQEFSAWAKSFDTKCSEAFQFTKRKAKQSHASKPAETIWFISKVAVFISAKWFCLTWKTPREHFLRNWCLCSWFFLPVLQLPSQQLSVLFQALLTADRWFTVSIAAQKTKGTENRKKQLTFLLCDGCVKGKSSSFGSQNSLSGCARQGWTFHLHHLQSCFRREWDSQETHTDSHWRKTIQMQSVQLQGCAVKHSGCSFSEAHRRETVQVPTLFQGFCSQHITFGTCSVTSTWRREKTSQVLTVFEEVQDQKLSSMPPSLSPGWSPFQLCHLWKKLQEEKQFAGSSGDAPKEAIVLCLQEMLQHVHQELAFEWSHQNHSQTNQIFMPILRTSVRHETHSHQTHDTHLWRPEEARGQI